MKLKFSPYAWAKLDWFCHHGPTEIAGFGITDAKNPAYVKDFATIKQVAYSCYFKFDASATADFFDQQVDAGRNPCEFARIWLHTHPGDSPQPSGTDERVFAEVFGRCDWAIMFILARSGKTYCRLKFNTGPGGVIDTPVVVDYSEPFQGSDFEAWKKEYDTNIQQQIATPSQVFGFNQPQIALSKGIFGGKLPAIVSPASENHDDDADEDIFNDLTPEEREAEEWTEFFENEHA